MKQLRIAAVSAAAIVVLLAGCSKQESKPAEDSDTAGTDASAPAAESPSAEPGQPAAAENHVKFGNVDIGPITAVTCQIANGHVTINAEGTQPTTVELTDEPTPVVRSVLIGEAGAEGPSLMFIEGVSETPQTTRDGNRFTLTGSGLGTEAGGADTPVDTPFDIAVSCP